MIKTCFRIAKLSGQLLILKTSLKNPLLLRQLEMLFNKQLQRQSKTHPALAGLEGKVTNLRIDLIGIEWHILVLQQQIILNPGLHCAPAADLKIHLTQLPKNLYNNQIQQSVTLDGDIAAILHLQALAKNVTFDPYPGLVQIFGAQVASIIIDSLESINHQMATLTPKLRKKHTLLH